MLVGTLAEAGEELLPHGGQDDPPPHNRPGEVALSMGTVALVFSFVPVIGDLVAAVTGLLAVVLGVVGVRRSEAGVATNFGQSLIGAALGTLAIFAVLLMVAVTR